MANTMIIETRKCMVCHQTSMIEVDVDKFRLWQRGEYIQTAFPDWTADQREMLLTGTHPKCWDAMFSEDER